MEHLGVLVAGGGRAGKRELALGGEMRWIALRGGKL